MPIKICLVLALLLSVLRISFGQTDYIHSSEGNIVVSTREFFGDCLSSYLVDDKSTLATSICRCQIDQIDGVFSNKEIKKFTKNRVIDLNGLIGTNERLMKKLGECISNSGNSILIQVENQRSSFLNSCKSNLRDISDSLELSEQNLDDYCNCRAKMIQEFNFSDNDLQKLHNTNSSVFYAFEYECGKFLEKEATATVISSPIQGPASDTLSFLNIRGLSYLNVKIPLFEDLYWMLDTGASDLLINLEMEQKLKEENVLNERNFRGVRDYQLANGTLERCRTYLINDVKIGNYSFNNVGISVSDKGKKILVGRSLLNRFGSITLDNTSSKIYLTK